MMRTLAGLVGSQLVALALLLAGCSAPGPREISDGVPPKRLDPTVIADAVPQPETILARGNLSPYSVNGGTYHVMTEYRGFRQRGLASWYGTKFHGRLTSNGEVYDVYGMTAAHRTLPIPVYVEVTNLNNGRKAVVRVNDRGPFHPDRIIDLSYAAAVKLGFAEQGTALVEIRVLDADNRPAPRPALTTAAPERYFLQVGAFSAADAAWQLRSKLAATLAHPVQVTTVAPETGSQELLHRVRVGPIADYLEVQRVREHLVKTQGSTPTIITEAAAGLRAATQR